MPQVLGLTKASKAVYGPCDGGSHWEVDPEGEAGGLMNVAAAWKESGYLRESPGQNCSAGNTAQLVCPTPTRPQVPVLAVPSLTSRRRDCHSAAPPFPFSGFFNRDGESASAK